VGLTLITGTEDRQHAYVALSRGTHSNLAYVCTLSPKVADPAPGPRPAPELERFDRISTQRDGQPGPARSLPLPCRPDTGVTSATGRNGCGAPCAPPSCPGWTSASSCAPLSPSGI
jgi:hypothetical protein